ncbi:hypothetical protein [Endozoicomonas elysicola]|uniref:Uncharacterized protein n=1 Tax=Endozoicomonas elysicola TaxID=305900 RepID=A0A081KAQ9_9GAMM|nr:hypothetical protein [Endozoicomonas elysicola]KEI71235.1 hypothetical protein GV64_11215 [Endozoicomonas elysicola]
MELSVYIQKHSDQQVAELLQVPVRTVASWRRLERAPKTLQALNIIQKSAGIVTWEGIYQPYARHRVRRNDRLTHPS